MSQTQSEHGNFYLKKTNYTKIMRELRSKINEYHDYCHELAIVIYDILKENKVNKNEQDAQEFLFDFDLKRDSNVLKLKNSDVFEPIYDNIDFALAEIFRNKNNTLLKPRKSAYPKIINKENSFSIHFECYETTISAISESNCLSWDVEKGNKNCTRVNNSFIVKILFPILSKHQWKKDEGGYIRKEVESNSDYEEDERIDVENYCYLGGLGEKQKNNAISSRRF